MGSVCTLSAGQEREVQHPIAATAVRAVLKVQFEQTLEQPHPVDACALAEPPVSSRKRLTADGRVPAPNLQPPMTGDYLQAAFRALKDYSTQ